MAILRKTFTIWDVYNPNNFEVVLHISMSAVDKVGTGASTNYTAYEAEKTVTMSAYSTLRQKSYTVAGVSTSLADVGSSVKVWFTLQDGSLVSDNVFLIKASSIPL